jgi:hypothetical protein
MNFSDKGFLGRKRIGRLLSRSNEREMGGEVGREGKGEAWAVVH